ncbi:MAG: tyrosine recombinase XerC [Clostridiales bacterium]|nr:tyrosine recombinase XerC [Clostridiales bacterium]MDY4171126.1 tyrosine recombinase XerC [Evtepia sp.]
MADYWLEAPPILQEFLNYHESILSHSAKTVDEYFLDLRSFFRYLKLRREPDLEQVPFQEISILDVDLEFVSKTQLSEIYGFLTFLSGGAKSGKAESSTRARKCAAIRSFYNYLCVHAHQMDSNPTQALNNPKLRKSLPRYLSLSESLQLLEAVSGPNEIRDYCILTLFLNCGLRVGELVGLNVQDIREDTVRVLGKGNKERQLYLNEACLSAIDSYLEVRPEPKEELRHKDALFVSRNKTRLTTRAVENIVQKAVRQAGLDPKYSPHKLRHTAATLMLNHGVDIRTLQDVLGHENLGTTQIYTHISDANRKQAVDANPLAHVKKQQED